MKKSEIHLDLVKQLPALDHGKAQLAVDVIIATIAKGLADGDFLHVKGFGRLYMRARKPCTLYNPKLNKKVEVGPRLTCLFRPAASLQQRLNNNVTGQYD